MGLAKQIRDNGIFRALFLLFQLLNTILLSRLTGPSGFGIYSLLVVNASFLLMLTSLGIPSGILYHASVRDIKKSSLVRMAWISTLLQLVFIVLLEWLHHRMQGSFLVWRDESLAAGIWGIVFFLFIVLTEKYYALYSGYGQLARYNKITAILNVLLFAALTFIFFLPDRLPLTRVIQLFISLQVLQFLVLALVFHRMHQPDPGSPGQGARMKLVTYALQSYLANLVFFLLTRIDFWLLEYFKGPEQLGIYALSVRIVQLLLILPALISSVTLPNIASGILELNVLQRVMRILNSVNLLAVVLMLLCAPWLVPLVFGEQFSESATVLLLLLPGILFLSASTLLSAYFAGKRQVRVNIIASAIALMVATPLDILLIPGSGVYGAAIASSIGYFACFSYQYLIFRRQENMLSTALLVNRKDMEWAVSFLKR